MAEKGRPARPGWVADKAVRYLWRPRHGRDGEPRRLNRIAIVVALAVILGVGGATYAVLRNRGTDKSSADVSPPIPTFTTPDVYPSDPGSVGRSPSDPGSVSPSLSASATSPARPSRSATASKRPSPRPSGVVTPVWGQRVIASTSVLTTGESWSTNRLRLTVTAGGNLVLQDQGRTVWQTGTTTGVKLVMQNDGHLVLYDAHNGTAWSSGTAGNPGAVLILRADGNMVISLNGRILFQTGT
jgi:hypothetical protein